MADVKTVRLRHITSGAVVEVRQGKALGSEWQPVDAKPAKRSGKSEK